MSVRGFVNWRAFHSEEKEVVYGDGTGGLTATYNMEPSATDRTKNKFTDREEVTGKEEATEATELSKSAEFSQVTRAFPDAIAFFGAAAFGEVVTAIVHTVGGDVYRHDITLTTSPGLLPSFAYAENIGGLALLYSGGVMNRLAITGERNDFVKIEADVMAAGTFTEINTVRPAQISEPAIRTSEVQVWVGTGAVATTLNQSNTVSNISSSPNDLGCVLQQLNWSLSNNLLGDDGFGFGTGLSRCQLERGQRLTDLAFTREFDGTILFPDVFDKELNQAVEFQGITAQEIVSGSGFFYGFVLALPRVRLRSHTFEGDRGKIMESVEADPLEQSATATARLTVWNTSSVYLS